MTASPILSVSDIDVRFGTFQALSKVTFDIAEGELLALIGPNGAGKTTMINTLVGEVGPTTGRIEFQGESIAGLSPHLIARRGFVRTFQAADQFDNLNVRENVLVGAVPGSGLGFIRSLLGRRLNRRAIEQLTEDADGHLKSVGLIDKAELPAALLTAGQRRLLSIARALATRARFLLLDEPGSGLNESEKTLLGDVIQSLSDGGKTIIFVDHDMPLVSRIARRIMVLDRGRLIADGTPQDVRADEKVLKAYLGPRETKRPKAAAVPAIEQQGCAEALLDVRDLSVSYGGLIALDGVSLAIGKGEIVSLVGANGAGKSSLLKAIGRIEACRASGMTFLGQDLMSRSVDQAVALGVSLVPEGRALFGSLTVAENLAGGRYAARRASGFGHLLWQSPQERLTFERLLTNVYELFPTLKERSGQLAGTLSGGQGQMLAIGRALMADPKLLMLDEPSLGLAPRIVAEIFDSIVGLRDRGLTVLLVEQNVTAALEACDHGYVLANGRVVASGAGRDLLRRTEIADAYLGGSGAGKKAIRQAVSV